MAVGLAWPLLGPCLVLSTVHEPVDSPNISKAPGPIRSHFGVWKLRLPKISQLELSHRQPYGAPRLWMQCLSATRWVLMPSVEMWLPVTTIAVLHPGGQRQWPLGMGDQSWNLTPSPMCLQDVNGPPRELRPRLCHLRKGPQGYGFNLHSDKSRPGQYIRSVDPGSPAAHSGLRAQDRLIEVPITEASGYQVPRVRLYLCPLCACLCLRPLFVSGPQVLPGRRGVSGNLSWHSSCCHGW